MNSIEYSFIVPIYNDAYLAPAFCQSFQETFQRYLGSQTIATQVELIFVNDGSRNNSMNELRDLVSQFPFVKIIDLSRNFGQHIAIAAGFKEAKGKYVGRMNVDMQDPPSEIPKLLDVIKNEDVDMVVGLYEVRYSHWLNKVTAHFFFVFFNWLTGQNTPQNTAPLRVMNRRFLDAYNQLREKTRFPQGLENWLGFKQKFIKTEHRPRIDTKSSYNLKKRLKLAIEGAIAFSDRPLKIMVYGGFLIALLGAFFVLNLVVNRFIFHTIVQGYTSTIALITLFSGLQILVIGVTGLYVGRILQEVQDRPVYLIREKINFEN